VLTLSLGFVVAEETGFFIDIFNSDSNISTSITNSTVIENVTLTNGTLSINVNSDNISSVIINGVNYTSADSSQSQTPEVIITYIGENMVPDSIQGFPNRWWDPFGNQSEPSYYYSWNLTVVNINPVNSFGVPIERSFQILVPKYPQLATTYATIPNTPYGSGPLTLRCDTNGFNGRLDKQCIVLFSYSQLSNDEIGNLTKDIRTVLTPAIIDWYS
jgi:hypothetical protein